LTDTDEIPFTAQLHYLADRLFDDPTEPDSTMGMTDELRLARYVLTQHRRGDYPTLRYYLGDWYEWDGCWRPLEPQQFVDRLYRLCKRYLLVETAKLPPKDGKEKKAPQFGKALAGNVTMALQSLVSLGGRKAPCWFDGRDGRWLAFRDRLLNLDAWLRGDVECVDQTPAYFAPNALNYPLQHTDAEPTLLLEKLNEQFSPSEVACLQEFAGYCMTAETDIQRAVLMVGPPRSFKGTFERVIRATIGEHNCASKTLKAFNSPHAMEDLPGKTFLGISDQRGDDKVSAEALERLLGIVGQDQQSINPKGKTHYTAALDCKLMIVSNVVLNFDDDTGAALARFLFLQTRKSYAGREDPTLLKCILSERNQVTWWALRGLRRLLTNQRYTEPENGLREQFARNNSPVKSFVEECCQLSGEVEKDALHNAYLAWCDRYQVTELDDAVFFRRLYATYKTLTPVRARDGTSRANRVRGVSLTS
jgi:putative DNA primase/helicase